MALSPDQAEKIVAAGLALIGLLGAFMPDKLARRASEGRLAIIVLAALTLASGPAHAQYMLPFGNNHEQRLKALEQKITQTPQQQAQPAPVPQQTPAPQPIIIQVPAQPAAPSAPPQIVYRTASRFGSWISKFEFVSDFVLRISDF